LYLAAKKALQQRAEVYYLSRKETVREDIMHSEYDKGRRGLQYLEAFR
jgi:hypothetical protein